MHHFPKVSSRVISLFLCILVLASFGLAQTSKGTIAGTVTDNTGAAVVGANITALSKDSGEVRTVVSGPTGNFRLDSLNPGSYKVTVTAAGFSTLTINDMAVSASVITPADAKLKVGGAETTVNVEGNALQLQTESGEISGTLDTKEISDLPISSVNAYALALTLPGVTSVTTSSMTNGTDFSVNGMRPRANNFLIEGQDNNDAGIHGQAYQPNNLEAVKEVSVFTNSYSAEFGHGGASVSNLVFKSGTNQFHGAVWDRLWNSSLDATDHNDTINGVEKSKYRENQYGFSLGGPIKSNKLFFFTSYQWDKYRSSLSGGLLTLPTEAGYATLQSMAGTNPRIAKLLQAYGSLRGKTSIKQVALGTDPITGLDRGTAEFGRVAREGIPNTYESPEFDIKGDYIVTKNDTVNLRYVRNSYTAPYDIANFPNQLPGFDSQQGGTAHNAGITYTHIFSPSLLNELRVSYGRIGFTFDNRPDTYANPLALGPTVSISGISGFGANSSVPQGRFHNTYQYQDSISWTTGSHFLKIGADIADIRVRDAVPYNFYGSIGYADAGGFSGLANYIDDFGGASTQVAQTFGSPIVHAKKFSQNYFIQDTWKVRPNLTFDLGLRYENNGTPANDLPYPAMNINDPFPADYPSRIPQVSDSKNFGPRVGFAYSPRGLKWLTGETKTVIRGGFGVFYDGIFTNILDNTQASSPNSVASARTSTVNNTTRPRGVANWSSYLATLSQTPSPLASQTSMDANLKSPATYQWNFSIQRELPLSLMFTAGYVGTHGIHLLSNDQLNPVDVETGARINPARGSILIRDNTGSSMYHGLNVEVETKQAHGLLLRAAYTYSKSIDTTSEVFTDGNWSSYPVIQYPFQNNRAKTDRGLSMFDHRQRLSLAYVWDLPKWKPEGSFQKGLSQVTNGWQLSGTTAFQSGNPLNIFVGYDVNSDGISNDRPDLGNPNAPMYTWAFEGSTWAGTPVGTYCEGSRYWNSPVGECIPVSKDNVHWIVPAYGTPGNIGRNAFITPGIISWNMGITRTFKIREGHEFIFRSEMFNVFNHGNTGNPDATLTSIADFEDDPSKTTFMDYKITNEGHRNVRFLLKYQF